MIHLKGNPEKIIKSLLRNIRDNGELVGKSKSLYNVSFELDPTLLLIDPKKNWRWALVELYDRLDPYYVNPGYSFKFRPRWSKKLTNEGGRFVYTYHERFMDQLSQVNQLLSKRKHTKEAVVSVYSSYDLTYSLNKYRVPCTLNLHFYLTGDKLNLTVYMRTNDVVNMLIYDIFHHSYLLLLLSSSLGLQPGRYTHVSTIMYYQKKREMVGFIDRYLDNPVLFERIEYNNNFYLDFMKLIESIHKRELFRSGNRHLNDIYFILNNLINNMDYNKNQIKTEFFKRAVGGLK